MLPNLTRRHLAAIALWLTLAIPAMPLAQEGVPVIAAASDLKFAITEIAAAFKTETGMKVQLTTGSTGNFARQIREGAPFQIFMAADESYILDLARDGFARNQGDLYALGRIVVMVPHGSPIKADDGLDDLAAGLADGRVTRFAIANPDHAPYGRRAMEALQHRGIWQTVQPALILGENVSQAAQFATSGDAQGGIIAYSLALSPAVSALGRYALIPEDWHAPLRQRMVLLNDAGPEAKAFYAYMQGETARKIMEAHGFTLPKDAR